VLDNGVTVVVNF